MTNAVLVGTDYVANLIAEPIAVTNSVFINKGVFDTIIVTNLISTPNVWPEPVTHTLCYIAMAGAFIVGAVFAWFWLTRGKWRLT